MSQIVWFAYFLLYAPRVLARAIQFGHPSFSPNLYYTIMRHMHPYFWIPFMFNFFQIGINLIHVLVLFLYIFHIKIFNRSFWQVLFVLRIAFDVCGHGYALNEWASYYIVGAETCFQSPTTSSILCTPWHLEFVLFLTFFVPSYIASYMYAFGRWYDQK